ncbi:PREDICTED: feruloyl CoA ortho-hydroxylase 2-like [Nicotiana attenuata]|uniref:feruloyl CoA ortho-hydroxylase 2-like n=1 Tax=Nicotiana attenuata TaxID=49451 RepID=UPI000904CBCA|nr:PREDICTED: feruloyl CoA ortho-hydroxylase 2-like [Nicotiana attenuata]
MVADALSRKVESMESLAFIPAEERPLAMDIQALANKFSFLFERIKARQYDDLYLLVLKDMVQQGGAKKMFTKDNGEAHNSRYSIHPGVAKIYHDLKQHYRWRKMKKETVREEALDFLRNFETVIKKLLEALMKGLNVKEIDQTKESLLMGSKRINVNYYPKYPNLKLTVGVGRHSDVSTLTILLQDNIGGLYVKKLDSETWVHVPPIHGALVINIGDALQIVSNGRYKSIEHRVMANGSNNRISFPIFVNPKPSDVIGPLAEVLENGEEPIYKQVLYSDCVKHFFRKLFFGEKLFFQRNYLSCMQDYQPLYP